MNSVFKNLEKHFEFETRKGFLKLFLAVLFFKLSLFLFKILFIKHGSPVELPGFWGVWAGDTGGYIDPFEDLHEKGEYLGGYRMPLYGFIYFLFRLVFSKVMALNSLLLLQIVVSGVAVVLVGKIVFSITKIKGYAIIALVVTAVSFQTLLYDWYLLPQSLVSAFLIIYAYYAIQYFLNLNFKDFRLAVLFSFLILFIYPVFFGVLLFLIIGGIYINRHRKLIFTKQLIAALLPFLILEGLWVYRNYLVFHTPHPLAATYNAFGSREDNEFKHELFQFGMATGVDICAWQPNSELRYFQHIKVPLPDGTDGYDTTTRFPVQLVVSSSLTTDSIVDLRSKIKEVRESHDSLKTDALEAELNRFTGYVKKEKPFQFWIGSRVRLLRLFFTYKGNDSAFFREGNHSFVIKALKPYVQALYRTFLFLSLLYPLSLLLNKTKPVITGFLLCMYGYVIFIFPLVFKVIEHRYFSSGFPFIIIIALMTVYNFLGWKKRTRVSEKHLNREEVYA